AERFPHHENLLRAGATAARMALEVLREPLRTHLSDLLPDPERRRPVGSACRSLDAAEELHSDPCAVPRHAAAHSSQLVVDRRGVLLLPRPGLPAAGAPPRPGVVIRFGWRARRGGAGH